ncbi:SUN domain-containing protein 3-like [Aricia agestis]|uniref:SUN domain-containing protein 3-like n=1 Tax=Aricia agestis TaxID=91739 RepID=UPI001C20729F|nr:SUN domain-containing protein 3-like [Aricia agestis]
MLFTFFLLAVGIILHRISDKIPRDLMPKFLWSSKFISQMFQKNSEELECSSQIRYLSLQLASAEKALRKALRLRKTTPEYELAHTLILEPREVLILDAQAVAGADTVEWGTQLALWGLIPLWQAAPPPDIVLSLRPPTPSDCWPFSGSRGELIVSLPSQTRVDRVSIEHVRPDTARSAPRNFTIYGTLANGTWIKLKDGVYQRHLPTKQYYSLQHKTIFWDKIVFQILSNHGNTKYTCIYRFHLYKYTNSDLIKV